MKRVFRLTIKSLLLIVLSFCVFNIIRAYAGEPIFKIAGITVKDKSSGVTVNDVDLNNGEITNDVIFTDVTDYITYNIKFKNTSEDDYIIKSITDNNTSEYLNYSYSDLNNLIVKAGNEKDVDLTITYFKQATDPELSLGSTTITITYEQVVVNPETGDVTPTGETKTEDIIPIINPKTGDNVTIYFVLSALSIIGLIVLSKNKNKSKLLVISLAVLIPLYAKANTLKLTIKFNNTLKATAYDVEMDLGNGTNIFYRTLAKGAKLTKPTNPTKRGYTFDNWYLNNEAFDFNTPITSNITLEARFNLVTYTISYDLDGGSLESGKSNPTEYDVNSPSITLNNPSKVGHEFDGWKLNGSDDVVPTVTIFDEVGDKSYKAIYTPINYTITFNPNNGQSTFTTNADYGTKISAPSNPHKDGYTFNYWSLNDVQFDFVNTTIEGAITLVANYTANGDTPYKVTHKYRHLNDSGFDTVVQDDLTGTTDTDVELAFIPRKGFLNPTQTKKLHINGDGSSEEEYIYERDSYSLVVSDRTYVNNSSSLDDDYLFESPITLIANDRTGYDFVGWKVGQDIVSTSITYEFNITSDVTIKPVYEVQNYTITFDPSNGQNTFTTNADYGTKISAPQTDPSKDGYGFDYWTLNNQEFDFANTNIEGPITLVAHYTPTVYHISYTLNGGDATNVTEYTIEDTIHLNNPTKTGYDFVGWSKNDEVATSDDVTISNQFGDVIYVAHYTPRNDTHYQVIHKYRKLNSEEFDIETVDYYNGTTGNTVIAPLQERTGFVSPTEGTVTVLADGSGSKVYEYERKTYSFTLNDPDSLVTSNVASGQVEHGTSITLTAGEKTGHTFTGWSNNETENPYTFTLTDALTISPVYTANSYTITYNPNNGQATFTDTATYGDTITAPSNNPTYTGYVFDYWTLNNQEFDFANTPITGDITLVAHYSASTGTHYQVIHKYRKVNSEEFDTETVDYYDGTTGETITAPLKEKTGFISPTEGTVTVLADGSGSKVYEYEREKYEFTLNDPDSLVTSNVASGLVEYGTSITLTAGEKAGHKFTKWSNDATNNPYTFTITGDLTIEPVYTINSYSVVFDPNNGGATATVSANYGTTVTAPTPNPTKDGYDFDYWTLNDVKYDFNTPITDTITLLAHYTLASYTITYDLDGGSVATPNPETYNINSNIVLVNPTKEGYTFDGWTKDSDSTILPTVTILNQSGNVTYTAHYTPITYNISYELNGGTVETANPSTYNIETPTFTLNNPSKEGYTFDGWSLGGSSEVNSTVTITLGSTGSRTYTAHYTQNVVNNAICIKATELNHATCASSSGKGCRLAGYADQADITYGSIISDGKLSAGDALDCNVDGTGYNQRFYYLRAKDGNAVLISNNNFAGDLGQNNESQFLYTVALTKFPRSADQWTNLPVTFGDYAARMLTLEDVKGALYEKTGSDESSTTRALSQFSFLFENLGQYTTDSGIDTIWLEKVGSSYNRYHVNSLATQGITNGATSNNSIRPVIEVPFDNIDDKAYIVFNYNSELQETSYKDFKVNYYAKGSTVTNLPTPTREGYTFIGWYTDGKYGDFNNEFENGDTINQSITLYAKWYSSNAAVEYKGIGYESFTAALEKTDSNKSTLKLLKNHSERVNVPTNKDIVIDLNGYTLSNSGTNEVIVTALNTNSNVYIKNGTITSTASGKPTIDNKSTGTMVIDDVNVSSSANRSAIWTERGTVILRGGSVITGTNSLRPTVINSLNGTSTTLYIEDATVTSSNINAVYNMNGTVYIGKSGEILNDSTPIIAGENYGIVSNNNNVYMYDGIIKGKTSPVCNGTINTKNTPITFSCTPDDSIIIVSEQHFEKQNGTDGDYSTYYLDLESGKYLVHFRTNGGEVSPQSMIFDEGSSLTNLPIPTKDGFTFDGWYKNSEFTGNQVQNGDTPEGTLINLYAKWF